MRIRVQEGEAGWSVGKRSGVGQVVGVNEDLMLLWWIARGIAYLSRRDKEHLAADVSKDGSVSMGVRYGGLARLEGDGQRTVEEL